MEVQRAGIEKGGLLPVLESVGIFQQLESSLSAVPAPLHLWFQQWLRQAPFSMILCLVKPLPSFMSSEGLLMLPAATLHRVTRHN